MGIVGVLARTAQSYPALLPIIVGSIAVAVWAFRGRRWRTAAGAILLGAVTSIIYTGALPALGLSRGATDSSAGETAGLTADSPPPAADLPRTALGEGARKRGKFSSTARLHPRFPPDFQIPATFRLESNSGGSRRGTITARFRFRGEGADAVKALKELGVASGWEAEVKAPHRLVFRKGGRIIEAWFSYAAHSVVLDIPDPR
jgi:hypothetical protein